MALNNSYLPSRRREFVVRTALAVVLSLMLVAGLAPGDYRFRNEVSWIGNGPGLQFGQFGIAYTEPFLTAGQANRLNQSGVTLLIGLMLAPQPQSKFQFIASFHNGEDASQLVIAQWKNSLIVMNGDDYSHARKTPRISADVTRFVSRPILLTISTSPSATLLAIDGEIIGRREGLQLFLPAGTRNSRLTLGNSVHSDDGWSGSLLAFGVMPRPLAVTELKDYRDEWLKRHDLKFVPPTQTIQLLPFDERSGDLARDFSGAAHDAILPAWPTAIERSLLSDDPTRDPLSTWRLRDFAVNLLGFIPFGLLLAVWLSNRGWRTRNVVTMVILCGFILSLGIETAQSWLPTRSSSAVDLLLNTLGAAIGAVGFRKR